MKNFLAALVMIFASGAVHAATVGEPAPDFTAKAASGRMVKLSDYRGKIVVLEWSNPECPFVRKFYESKTMQKLQADAVAKKIVWLTVNSSAKGNQGYVDEISAQKLMEDQKINSTEYLLDSDGKIGHLYGAKTTPHMFVIDPKGMLAYAGAIDDKPSPKSEDIPSARNYVTEAIYALMENKKIDVTSTQSYGCNVKY